MHNTFGATRGTAYALFTGTGGGSNTSEPEPPPTPPVGPVPQGEHPRYYGPCADPPFEPEDIHALPHSDHDAVGTLTARDSGTSPAMPWYAFALPVAYGEPTRVTMGDEDKPSGQVLRVEATIDEVEYVVYLLQYTAWENTTVAFA